MMRSATAGLYAFVRHHLGNSFVAGRLLALAERTLYDAVVKASEVDDAGD